MNLCMERTLILSSLCLRRALACWLIVVVVLSGCGEDEPIVPSAEQRPAKKAESPRVKKKKTTAKKKRKVAGLSVMRPGAQDPVKFRSPAARLDTLSVEGAPSVLTIISSSPKLFLRAKVMQKKVAALKGATIQAKLFVEFDRNGPPWQSLDGTPAALEVTDVDGKLVTFKMPPTTIHNSVDDRKATIQGEFQATVK
jgi:hypothetical protein